MALGSWDPDAEKAASDLHIDLHQLQRFIRWARGDQLDQLATLLSGDERQTLSGLMHMDGSHWQQVAESHNDDDLLQLIRFFTIAEALPGWEAGETSPVIPLAKSLRQRGTRLDREYLQWIRAHSKNRFLPYGPL